MRPSRLVSYLSNFYLLGMSSNMCASDGIVISLRLYGSVVKWDSILSFGYLSVKSLRLV